ncbi:hypothetical protein H6501_00135 [Candidatus Woesearchaeota archaeon]|nr:hypothetical protein [Nanoarchaeota archaeon]MCB9369990.1 hypothetical protein [Candidatus Woesearchaeota archaeon]USN44525.1 MAG: hypothetical protein H6500_01605 [Candidatus Woesearchaeota archaeon]
MDYKKKAISPVVATALLLVVAVVAVVGFQAWYNSFQSSKLADAEQQSNSGVELEILRLDTDGTVWVKNSGGSNVSIQQSPSKITTADGTEVTSCSDNSSTIVLALANNVSGIPLNESTSNCSLTAGVTYNVVLVTASRVYDGKFNAK